ncbi:unnamed protein product [Discula destructiva]
MKLSTVEIPAAETAKSKTTSSSKGEVRIKTSSAKAAKTTTKSPVTTIKAKTPPKALTSTKKATVPPRPSSSSELLTDNQPSTTVTAPIAPPTETPVSNTTLVPITKPVCESKFQSKVQSNVESEIVCTPPSLVPKKNVTLDYGVDDNTFVQIALAMQYETVVLEDVPSIKTVDCDMASKSVWITFDKTADFTTVTGHWRELVDSFVLITNHMGNCDNETERGFFLADIETMSITPANMSVRLFAEATDALSTGKSMDLTFEDAPAAATQQDLKRGVDFHKNGLTMKTDMSLTPGLTLNSARDAHFTLVADHAQINASITYSGALKYSFHDRKMTEFWFDVKKDIYYNMGLTFQFKAPYIYTLEYDIPIVAVTSIHIPCIISLGPELTLAIAVDFDVKAQLQISTNFSSTVTGGLAHVDFLNSSNTFVSNWKPTYTATADISKSGGVQVTPQVQATMQLACSLFNDALDLSTGVSATAAFPFTFGATTTQAGVGSGNVTLPEGKECKNGFGYNVDFKAYITAFATSWVSKNFDVYKAPIGAWCMPWIGL